MNEDDFDDRLSRLARATEALGPSAGFVGRVLAAVEGDREPGWREGVVRFGRAMLAVAALSALAGLAVAFESERSADLDLAMTYGMEEAGL